MKIRNKNTGAEISSPYLVRERNNNTKAEWFIDHKSNTGVFYLADGWEEVKEDNSSIEEAAKLSIQDHYNCNGEYPCDEKDMCCFCNGTNSAYDCCECGADEYEDGFKAGAIWMRDKYLNENGINKVFEEWNKSKWHESKEKLPPENKDLLILIENNLFIGCYNSEHEVCRCIGISWIPLKSNYKWMEVSIS